MVVEVPVFPDIHNAILGRFNSAHAILVFYLTQQPFVPFFTMSDPLKPGKQDQRQQEESQYCDQCVAFEGPPEEFGSEVNAEDCYNNKFIDQLDDSSVECQSDPLISHISTIVESYHCRNNPYLIQVPMVTAQHAIE